MTRTDSARETGQRLTVEEGTRLATDPALRAELETALASARVDPALLQGVFATNVWAGRYEVESFLGAGSQGATFAGVDRKTGARVAIKVLNMRALVDWKRLELFEREARVLRRLDHPSIPAFLDVIEDADTGARALVMSHVPGTTLAERVKDGGALSEAELWRVLFDVSDVLATLHQAQPTVLHRDLKPQNLVLRPDGGVSVVDFGGVGEALSRSGSTVVGTFGYLAPEQLYAGASPSSDLYALGATLLALATGREPEELPRQGLGLDVDRAAPALSPALRDRIRELVAPDPAARPRDGVALRASLAAQGQTKGKSAPRVDANFDVKADSVDDNLQRMVAFLLLITGLVGIAFTVVIGEVLLPVALAVASAVTAGEKKRNLLRMRLRLETGARAARGHFESTARRGATALEERQVREFRRQLEQKNRRAAARAQKGGRGRRR